MPNDPTAIQKADQIAHRFFNKFALVIHNARATVEPSDTGKVDKWFNLETPDTDAYKDHLRSYRSISSLQSAPPPFELQVLLTIPELTNNQVLVLHDPPSSRTRVDPTPTHILLESWMLSFSPMAGYVDTDRGEVTLATVYKHGMSVFRSLFALLHVLPAWKLHKRLRRRPGSLRNGNLGIEVRVGDPSSEGMHVLGFDSPISSSMPSSRTTTHTFAPVTHPLGSLSLTTTYLTTPDFQVDTMESLLSSRFFSLDEGPGFTPTLARNQQRDSISSSPGSLPIRTSLPHSPPSATSIADRFILPAGGRTAFPRLSPQSKNIQLPSSHNLSEGGFGSGGSAGSSSRLSREEGRNVSMLPSHSRRESTGAGRGADLPSAPAPLPIRRPSINSVHPFKSSFPSPAPSLRQHSPLSSGPSLPSRPPLTASPVSTSSASRLVYHGPPPASPVNMGGRAVSSPGWPLRPSPPFTPSSLGDRRAITSESVVADAAARPKRYSSSFGHRYTSGGAGSEGSAGSGDRKDGERVGSASYMSANTDDDDISLFVQDIDARMPLKRRSGQAEGNGKGHERSDRATDEERDGPTEVRRERRERTTSAPDGLWMGQTAVDERLRKMNETFLASLVGMERRRGGGSRSPARRPSPMADVVNTRSAARRIHSGTDLVRRAATISVGAGAASRNALGMDLGGTGSSGSASASGSVFESGPGSGYSHSRARRGSAGGSGGSEEIMGRLELDTYESSPRRSPGVRRTGR